MPASVIQGVVREVILSHVRGLCQRGGARIGAALRRARDVWWSISYSIMYVCACNVSEIWPQAKELKR